MKDNKFLFCPQCSKKNIQTQHNGLKWTCPDCGFVLFCNIASAVGLLICDDQNRVLFERRAQNPRKGFLAFPGGFTECDESAEEAAYRECEEETGVRPVSLKYLCSFPNTYEFKDMTYKTCDMFFEAKLPEHFTLRAQEGEVDAFEWIKILSEEDVQNLPLAFDSARKTLNFWLKKNESVS